MASTQQFDKDMITIYTDGACSGNPGIGGWGVVILNHVNKPILLNGGEQNTTNNRMELNAAIKAVSYFDNKDSLFCFVKYIALDICNNNIPNKENSITLMIGLMFSSISTIPLKTPLPKNKVILFPK